MAKKIIRITENDIREIVMECVGNIMNEEFDKPWPRVKRSLINKLYKTAEPFTRSKYSDTGWQAVSSLIEAIENAGFKVGVSVKDGGYRNSKGGNTMFAGSDVSYWKEYDLEIPVEDKVIYGQIKAHAAGTVEDPFKSYDMTCTFW